MKHVCARRRLREGGGSPRGTPSAQIRPWFASSDRYPSRMPARRGGEPTHRQHRVKLSGSTPSQSSKTISVCNTSSTIGAGIGAVDLAVDRCVQDQEVMADVWPVRPVGSAEGNASPSRSGGGWDAPSSSLLLVEGEPSTDLWEWLPMDERRAASLFSSGGADALRECRPKRRLNLRHLLLNT